jgi:hypothetical protein
MNMGPIAARRTSAAKSFSLALILRPLIVIVAEKVER